MVRNPLWEPLPINSDEQMTKASYRIEDLFPAMEKESDLGLLITGAVVIEYALRAVLEPALHNTDELQIFDEFHALGSYRARLDMCFALGLIDRTLWNDLRTIGEMRNDAAHLKQGASLSLNDQTFADRISLLHEIEVLRQEPELLQEDRPVEERTGVLHEGPRSQLHWSLVELLIKLEALAPRPPFIPLPLTYQIGDRVKVKLHADHKVPDLKGRSEAVGTIVETPGGLVYNVLLDEPPDPRFNTLTYLTDEAIIEKL